MYRGLELLAIGALALCAHAEPLELVVDAPMGKPDHLYNFRRFEDLKISGSSQFSELGLKAVRARIPARRVTIVDLRQESHGFAAGLPVSWEADANKANQGKAREDVQADEARRLAALSRERRADLTRLDERWTRKTTQVFAVRPGRTLTEEQLAREAGLGYVRFAVTDHTHPADADVDRFVALRAGDPAWLHFHCKAGIGRTSVFMAMADMMQNARTTPAREIIARQGGAVKYDLEDTRSADSRARRDFLHRFHRYCAEQTPEFRVPWSRWASRR